MLSCIMNPLEEYYLITKGMDVGLHKYQYCKLPLPQYYHPMHLEGLKELFNQPLEMQSNMTLLKNYARALSHDDFLLMAQHLATLNSRFWSSVLLSEMERLNDNHLEVTRYLKNALTDIFKQSMKSLSYDQIQLGLNHGFLNVQTLDKDSAIQLLLSIDNGHEIYKANQAFYFDIMKQSVYDNHPNAYQFLHFLEYHNLEEEWRSLPQIILFRFEPYVKNKTQLIHLPASFIPYVQPEYWISAFYGVINSYISMGELIEYFEKIKNHLGHYAETLYRGLLDVAEKIPLQYFQVEIRHLCQENIIQDQNDIVNTLYKYCPNIIVDRYEEQQKIFEPLGIAYSMADAIIEFGTILHTKIHNNATVTQEISLTL